MDLLEGNRTLWVNIRTFSPLSTTTTASENTERTVVVARTRLKLCLVSFTWRYKMYDDEEELELEEGGGDVVANLTGASLEQPVGRRPCKMPCRTRDAKRALLKVTEKGHAERR